MPPDTEALIERWILTFLEPPSLVDAALMALPLDAHEARRTDA